MAQAQPSFTFTVGEVMQKIGALTMRVDQLDRQLADAQREAARLRAECDRLLAVAAQPADGAPVPQ